MDRTLEVRWFIDGPIPFAVNEWADDLDLQHQSTRTDRYLISQDGGMNVKVRNGQIQTKRRLDGPDPLSFSEAVRGYREHWLKWSFPISGAHADRPAQDPDGLWVPVHKVRRQRMFSTNEYDTLLDAPLDQPTHSKLELTEVCVGEAEAYTICVEAEGPDACLHETLNAVGAALFEEDDAPDLGPDQSFGYAKWLATLAVQRALPSDVL